MVFNGSTELQYLRPREGTRPIVFTILRKPSAQFISAVNYFGRVFRKRDFDRAKVKYDPGMFDSWDRVVSLRRQLDKPQIAKDPGFLGLLVNSQARDLGWYSWQAVNPWGGVRDWIQHLRKVGVLFLLQEAFDEGLILLGQLHGFDVHDLEYYRFTHEDYLFYLKAKAPNRSVQLGLPNAAQAAEIQRLTSVDTELYRYANASFYESWYRIPEATRHTQLQRLRAASARIALDCAKWANVYPSEGALPARQVNGTCTRLHLWSENRFREHFLMRDRRRTGRDSFWGVCNATSKVRAAPL